MAQTARLRLTDGLDGSPADETVVVNLDGKIYEIDLSRRNADRLRAQLRPFVAAARHVGDRAR
jgi:hypothetical protein